MILFHNRQGDGELGTLPQVTLTLDLTLVEIHHFLHIGKTETEALHIVLVTRMHTVELIEDLLDILLLDALTGVTDTQQQTVMVVPRTDIDIQRFLRFRYFTALSIRLVMAFWKCTSST